MKNSNDQHNTSGLFYKIILRNTFSNIPSIKIRLLMDRTLSM